MQEDDVEQKKSLFIRLRQNVFPIKTTDNSLARFGKNAGFYLFLIIFSVVSLVIVVGIAFAI